MKKFAGKMTAEECTTEVVSIEQERGESQPRVKTSNREELIQCIKRGQRPTWVPKPGLQALYAEEEALQEQRSAQFERGDPSSIASDTNFQTEDDMLFGPWTSADEPMERRSAFHAGTFNERSMTDSTDPPTKSQDGVPSVTDLGATLSSSPPSWVGSVSQTGVGRAVSGPRSISSYVGASRPRAPSLGSSISSSLVMRVPTSPLVNAVNNPSLDFSPKASFVDLNDEDRRSRRKTMPPHAFQSYSTSSIDVTPPNFSRPLPHPPLRRESSLPFPTHQPRRSLGSFTYQPSQSPQTPRAYARRPSIASEMSPRQRLSMVGSFEESILRGRMSSPASKPLDFVAQIGVMGKGECPANLKCPAHVSIPFQAVFYNYPSSQSSRSIADDTPSPYVGNIDIEHNLKPVQLAIKKKRASRTEEDCGRLFSDSDPRSPENTPIGKALARESQNRQEKPTTKMDLGGAYRVPQQGQIQIIIKNANKTAVKLFLIPYDLQDMQPGTKTFVRQRSYSSGPIIEGILSGQSHQPDLHDPLKDKNILRYLIHLRFCSPAKGKYYLYDNIRVVFANRVPDGKEKLRNELQLPEPKYSAWKVVKTPIRHTPSSSADYFSFGPSSPSSPSRAIFDDLRAMRLQDSRSRSEPEFPEKMSISPHEPQLTPNRTATTASASSQDGNAFILSNIPNREERPARIERALSPIQGFFPSTSQRSSPVPWGSSGSSTTRSFSPVSIEAGSGLLSRQLRELSSSANGSSRTERVPSPDPSTATNSLESMISETSTTQSRDGDEELSS